MGQGVGRESLSLPCSEKGERKEGVNRRSDRLQHSLEKISARPMGGSKQKLPMGGISSPGMAQFLPLPCSVIGRQLPQRKPGSKGREMETFNLLCSLLQVLLKGSMNGASPSATALVGRSYYLL